MTFDELKEKVEGDKANPPSKGDCGLCEKPMISPQNITPGEPRFIKKDGKDVQVHDDCYFEELGNELEQFPIGRGRIGRRASRGPID